MESKKKICFVLPTLHAGGVENYTLRFLTFTENRFDVTVISKNTQRGDLHDQYAALGVKIIYKKFGYFNLKSFRFIYRLFKDSRYDTVCDFTDNFAGLALRAAKLAGVKKRMAFYRRSTIAFTPVLHKKLYNNFVNRLVYRNATDILSNSEAAFKNFFPDEYKTDKRFRIIPNGIQADSYVNIPGSKEALRQKENFPENAYIVGHVGRLDPAKNHTTLLKTAVALLEKYDDMLFILCGKWTDSPEFLKKIEATGYGHRIFALGMRSNVPETLKMFDVFYFPSVTEGQPNALIEAMIAGLPVITSDIGSIREATPESIHNTLVPPLDVDKHVEMLEKVRNDENFRKSLMLSEWAIKKFDYKKNFQLFEDEL